ncbi:MAG: hypothetical protein K9J12_07510 [Melioribacteraceae bacterium]|nr:hypothetical protein [Melioribacteraceae bacterium]MCF8263645.1 hypothetical protein [Melioribacteraceae bacterium]
MKSYNSIKTLLFLILISALPLACNAQGDKNYKLIGGPCEGCEAVFEYGDKQLNPVDTLPGFESAKMKLQISGTVFENDEQTPAEDVILYFHHTNAGGIYPTIGNETGWARRHGYIRGWIKTDNDGKYTIFTSKPGVYPSRTEPAHIHITVLEPSGKYYWIDSILFSDDPLLDDANENSNKIRGGAENILVLKEQNSLFIGERNVILGKNIPDY